MLPNRFVLKKGLPMARGIKTGGRRPTPAKILEMRGSRWANDRKKRDIGYRVPSISAEVVIKAPTWLSDEAKVIWKQVVAHLKPLGILGKIDTFALGRYCSMHVQWLKAKAFVEQHGQIISSKESKNRVSIRIMPQLKIMLALTVELGKLEHEYGMTPAARASFGMVATEGKPQARTGKDRFFAD
jgi:P27 family predicted phage terminase small subunit